MFFMQPYFDSFYEYNILPSIDSNDQFALQLNNKLKINNLFAVTDVIYLYIRMFFQHNIILSKWITFLIRKMSLTALCVLLY